MWRMKERRKGQCGYVTMRFRGWCFELSGMEESREVRNQGWPRKKNQINSNWLLFIVRLNLVFRFAHMMQHVMTTSERGLNASGACRHVNEEFLQCANPHLSSFSGTIYWGRVWGCVNIWFLNVNQKQIKIRSKTKTKRLKTLMQCKR